MAVQKSGWAVNPVGSSFDTAQWGQFSEEQRATARMDWSSLSNEQLEQMGQSSQEAVRWAAFQELLKRRGGSSVFQQGTMLTPESSTWGAFVDAQSPEGGVVNPNFQQSYQAGLEGQPSNGDEAIWQSLLQGTVMDTSRLATMTEGARKVQAATQLAKNLVNTLGQTQDVLDSIRKIHAQFIQDAPGAGDNFGSWARNTGIQLDVAGNLAGAGPPDADITGSPLSSFIPEDQPDEGTRPQDPKGTLDLQGIDKDIFDFLTGLYKKQEAIGTSTADIYDAVYTDGADTMIRTGSMFGQTFNNQDDAYKFLQDWLHNPLKGNIGASAGSDRFYTAVNDLTEWDPSAAVLGADTGADTGAGGFDMGGLTRFLGGAESLRPFGQIYPGFTSLLPGATTSPAVSGAYRQAEAPLEMQYLARQAMTPWGAGPPTAAETGSDIKTWLQNVHRGDQPLMMGGDYASFLNQLSGALGSELGALPSFGGAPMAQGRYDKLRGLFRDPAAQLSAFMNPFYGATSGAPAVRKALMDQINEAAQRHQYEYPESSFLPWAMEQNIGGIQGILPSLKGYGLPDFNIGGP